MPQEPLPPSLAALLARDDFASTIFESGRCAHSVGAASEWWTASSLALDSLLAALDAEYHRAEWAKDDVANWTGVSFDVCGYAGRFMRTMVTTSLTRMSKGVFTAMAVITR